jgi:hypothetical protein
VEKGLYKEDVVGRSRGEDQEVFPKEMKVTWSFSRRERNEVVNSIRIKT